MGGLAVLAQDSMCDLDGGLGLVLALAGWGGRGRGTDLGAELASLGCYLVPTRVASASVVPAPVAPAAAAPVRGQPQRFYSKFARGGFAGVRASEAVAGALWRFDS